MDEIGNELGLDPQTVGDVFTYLARERLVEGWGDGQVSITHRGIKEVERALEHPTEATEHFPPGVTLNINNFGGDVTGATIQQAGANSHQYSSMAPPDVRSFLRDFKTAIPNLGIDGATQEQTRADIAVVEAELKRASPKKSVIWEHLKSFRTILEGAAGGALGNQAPVLLEQVIKLLGGS